MRQFELRAIKAMRCQPMIASHVLNITILRAFLLACSSAWFVLIGLRTYQPLFSLFAFVYIKWKYLHQFISDFLLILTKESTKNINAKKYWRNVRFIKMFLENVWSSHTGPCHSYCCRTVFSALGFIQLFFRHRQVWRCWQLSNYVKQSKGISPTLSGADCSIRWDFLVKVSLMQFIRFCYFFRS